MRYEQLSKYQQSRVLDSICPICGMKITKLDDFQQIKMKYGKSILYFNFHSSCLLGWTYPHLASMQSSQLEKEENYEEATV